MNKHKQVQDYTRLQKIGEGSFGKIYKARQESSGRVVALKKLKLHVYRKAPQFDFEKEVALHVLLEGQPNVVQLREVLREEGKVYLVMEYFHTDLFSLLDQHHSLLGLQERLRLAAQLIEGVGQMHSRGVVHRDLKPSNLLVDSRLRLAITDLGISRPDQPLPMTKYVTTK